MKKIVILTTSLMLVSGGINATETLNKLVETKIEQSPITMEAPAPTIPVGVVFKAMMQVLKKAAKLTDELPYDEIAKILKISMKEVKELNSSSKAIGKALLEDMIALDIKIAKNIELERLGSRAIELSSRLGDNILETRKNVEDFYMLTKEGYNFRAIIILEENPTIKLGELASQVRKEVVAEKNGKKTYLNFLTSQSLKADQTKKIFTDKNGNTIVRELNQTTKKPYLQTTYDADNNLLRIEEFIYEENDFWTKKVVMDKNYKTIFEVNRKLNPMTKKLINQETYNDHGRLVEGIYPKHRTKYEYTDVGELLEKNITFNNKTKVKYKYNPENGIVIQKETIDVVKTFEKYDPIYGRLIEKTETNKHGSTLDIVYDKDSGKKLSSIRRSKYGEILSGFASSKNGKEIAYYDTPYVGSSEGCLTRIETINPDNTMTVKHYTPNGKKVGKESTFDSPKYTNKLYYKSFMYFEDGSKIISYRDYKSSLDSKLQDTYYDQDGKVLTDWWDKFKFYFKLQEHNMY